MVQIDPSLVEKALGQLIENAAKYSPPATAIEISADLGRKDDQASRCSDQGAGLSDDERERIWERFYRSPRQRGAVAGSGLGLWIARALIMACGGKIEASSAGSAAGFDVSRSTCRCRGPRRIARDRILR